MNTNFFYSITSYIINLRVVRNIMLTLPTNSANFIGRLFFLAVTFLMGYLFINFGLKEPNNGKVIFKITALHFEFKAVYIMYFLIGTIGFLALTILSSLLTVNKVVVDTTSDVITFTGLFGKQTIATVDISEYFETVHTNTFKSWTGLLIKTNDNKTIQVAGQNIKSISDLKDYLDERKIFYAGRKKMKFPFN
ncbi:MAG: hypothetical protein ABIN97_14945 [Ginsengibacter sp.]